MHPFPKHPRIPTSILAALVLPLALGCAAASADPVRIRGSVVSLDGAKLVVRSKEGKDVPDHLERQLCCPGCGEIVHRGYQAGHVHRNCD